MAGTSPVGGPLPPYGHADLEALRALAPDQVLELLGSFDETALDDNAFTLRAAALLDPTRVSGLAGAETAGAVERALRSFAGCVPAPETSASDADLRIARDALEHRFTFYDETHQLPPELDWDHNPGTAHWGHDLNRFTYLPPLVAAHYATGQQRFARKAVELMVDWAASNPITRCFTGTPYAYGSYLNNAIHCTTWARCLAQLLPTGLVSPHEFLRIAKSVHEQLGYLQIVTHGHAGNWPTIGCQGILATLAALPVFARLPQWAEYAVLELDTQLGAQVLPDGVQDELTPHYHSVVVNNILTAAESAQALGVELRPTTLELLRRMVHYQQQMTVPDGSAQVAFNDSDPEVVPRAAERLLALGLEDMVDAPDRLGPECFAYAGVALLRQRAIEGDLYLAFDGGPFGRSHQHEDKLGFWLHGLGRNFLVDPGRHLYDFSAASYLEHLRSTRAHSTVLVDGHGQNSRARPDTWIATRPTGLHFSASQHEVRAASEYDLGYGPDNAVDVVHRREIVLVENRFWVLFDRLQGQGEHEIECRFQFAPGELDVREHRCTTTYPDANLLLLIAGWDAAAAVECGTEDPRGGWYSPSYGHIEPAPALVLTGRAALALTYAVLLLPYPGTHPPNVEIHFDGKAAAVTGALGEHEVTTALV